MYRERTPSEPILLGIPRPGGMKTVIDL